MALIMCLLDFARVFLHIDSIFIGHKTDLSLLDKSRMFKNIHTLRAVALEEMKGGRNLNYLDFITGSLTHLPLPQHSDRTVLCVSKKTHVTN